MADYISREAVCYQLEKQESIDGQPRAIKRARRIVAEFPASDVVEARHGHWETDKEGRKTCSACGAWCICMRKDGLWLDKAAYCPYCGAKMDEEDEE